MALPPWLTDMLVGGGLMGLEKLLSGGGGEDVGTFEGETGANGVSVDPRDLLGQGVGMNADMLEMLLGQLQGGVSLPGAYAQQPPVFTGGGLPMPIGVSGMDPALADPMTHLTKAGLTYQQGSGGPLDLLGGPQGGIRQPRSDRGRRGDDRGAGAGDRTNTPYPPTPGQGPQMPEDERGEDGDNDPNNNYYSSPQVESRASLRTPGQDMIGQQGGSSQEALAALQLLGIK